MRGDSLVLGSSVETIDSGDGLFIKTSRIIDSGAKVH